MIRFIDEHKDRRSGQLVWGIEPIAKGLGIAPSTYHAAKTRPPSARAVRDAELKPGDPAGLGSRTCRSTGRTRCGTSSTRTASGWPAAPSSG